MAWMENNSIFMKSQGSNFILHGLFVDEMMHVSSCDSLCKQFMKKYTATFLVIEVQRNEKCFKLHLDH